MNTEFDTKTQPSPRYEEADTRKNDAANVDEVAMRATSTLETLERTIDVEAAKSDGDIGKSLPFDLPEGFLLSIIVPVYNERPTVAKIIETLYRLPLPIEVIAVDDGSTDGSAVELTRLNLTYPELRVLIQEKNQGKGAALKEGFSVATGSHVIVQDADFEYQPADIPSLIEPIALDGVDAVFGSRFLENRRKGSSTLHHFGNAFLTRLSNWMTGTRLTDMETGYKVVRRDLLNEFSLHEKGFGFEVELTAKLARKKAQIVERPIAYVARSWEEGKKIGIRDALRALYCIFRYNLFPA